jgi:hypothetical protein
VKPADVLALLGDELIPASVRERARLDDIDVWLSKENPVEAYRQAHAAPNPEKEALAKFSHTPILRLVVEECAQQMVLEGVHSTGRDTTEMWEPWERNGMPSRQGALWNAAIGYGLAYTVTLPGQVPGDSARRAAIRPVSPRDLFVVYGDVVDDEWPLYGLRTIRQGGGSAHYRLIDEEGVHYASSDESGALQYIEERVHAVGVTPIVRWANGLDLEARTPGEVEKFEIVAKRYNKTTYDRLLIQHYNSWRIKTATGLEDAGDTDENARVKALLRHEDVLTGGEGVEFGSLPETSMDGIIRAGDVDRDTIAALAQTPVWALNGGQLVNLAADAIVEARSASRLKVMAKQRSMGRSAAQNLRLSAHIEARQEDAADFALKMMWADIESRSMGQAADALGKIAGQLRVPVELLWDLIPGVSKTLADEWRSYAEEHPSPDALLASALDRQRGGA